MQTYSPARITPRPDPRRVPAQVQRDPEGLLVLVAAGTEVPMSRFDIAPLVRSLLADPECMADLADQLTSSAIGHEAETEVLVRGAVICAHQHAAAERAVAWYEIQITKENRFAPLRGDRVAGLPPGASWSERIALVVRQVQAMPRKVIGGGR